MASAGGAIHHIFIQIIPEIWCFPQQSVILQCQKKEVSQSYQMGLYVNNEIGKDMNKVRITAIRQTVYEDLMTKYENPIEHTCDVREGQQWISIDGQQPEGMCPSAWSSMQEFVESLARGEGNFYDGWMKNPMSAMISCNDGFRPFSFYIEVIE
jgi:uncharacterized repeat protein (TIGR04076 family)